MKPVFTLHLLNPNTPEETFPPVEHAWDEPNGLLAVGGDLSTKRLINAYRNGIFPWFGPKEPIYWWSPDPRAILYPNQVRITRSLRKTMRNKGYKVHIDRNFAEVVRACAAPRAYTKGTWITEDMFSAYCRLHEIGLAHSLEIYDPSDTQLIGGLYGVAIGGVFCGESMFSRASDASKMALVALAYHLKHWGFSLIDCQLNNQHLSQLGAQEIPRAQFLSLLKQYAQTPANADWQRLDVDLANWHP